MDSFFRFVIPNERRLHRGSVCESDGKRHEQWLREQSIGIACGPTDQYVLSLGIKPVIPTKENEDCEARGIHFDREVYRNRNIVERLIGWLKESRRVFSRFEKSAKNYAGMLKLAFIRQYLSYDVKITF